MLCIHKTLAFPLLSILPWTREQYQNWACTRLFASDALVLVLGFIRPRPDPWAIKAPAKLCQCMWKEHYKQGYVLHKQWAFQKMKHLLPQWAFFFSKCPASIFLVSQGNNNNAQGAGCYFGNNLLLSRHPAIYPTLEYNKNSLWFAQSK